jgi:hypothetical protein
MVAGVITSVLTLPADVVRTRVMNARAEFAQTVVAAGTTDMRAPGVVDVVRQLVQRDGLGALWRGWGPFYFKTAPAMTTMFVVYEQSNRWIDNQ